MHKFKAYRTFEEDKVVSSRFVELSLDDLDAGDVVVRTKYSTINYKDALSHNGTGRIMRKYPTVAGIDMAGTVESSQDPRWKRGDKVVVHGYDMGVAHDGGYSEYVRVPGDWIVRRPESMTAFDAMTLGTAGYTAALAIMLMEQNGLKPAQRAGRGHRRDRRRRLGRGRDPGEARLPRRGDHRQAGGAGLPDQPRREGGARPAHASTSRRSGRSTRRPGPARSTTSAATSSPGCCRR